jgi:(1->4)-alpha-D-glucan 1-alpha-D-glucosylmutase
VYRTYISARRCPPADRRIIEAAVDAAARAWVGPDRELFQFVRAALTGDLVKEKNSGYSRNDVFRFAVRFQQYTGPVMAKAVEDTAFYRYVRLLSHNEVGADPRSFAVTPAEFHAANRKRLADWPHTMIATATHDTKRGEDARVRLAALSELAEDWANAVARWRALNHGDAPAPNPRDEYLIYQALVGHWPEDGDPSFRDRLKAYLRKAVREAKLESSWADPNESYENACADFVDRCLDNAAFMAEFRPFAQRVARLGRLAGLAQLVLKCTVPGVPDFYQGTEALDLSFVDPDNRRRVDFARLGHTEKRAVMERLLALRRAHPALFARGTYAPIPASGARADHVVAFTRADGPLRLVVAVGRLFAPLVEGERLDWQDTTLALPGGTVRIADFLGHAPAAVLLGQSRIL